MGTKRHGLGWEISHRNTYILTRTFQSVRRKKDPGGGKWAPTHTGMDRKTGEREGTGRKTGSRLET